MQYNRIFVFPKEEEQEKLLLLLASWWNMICRGKHHHFPFLNITELQHLSIILCYGLLVNTATRCHPFQNPNLVSSPRSESFYPDRSANHHTPIHTISQTETAKTVALKLPLLRFQFRSPGFSGSIQVATDLMLRTVCPIRCAAGSESSYLTGWAWLWRRLYYFWDSPWLIGEI